MAGSPPCGLDRDGTPNLSIRDPFWETYDGIYGVVRLAIRPDHRLSVDADRVDRHRCCLRRTAVGVLPGNVPWFRPGCRLQATAPATLYRSNRAEFLAAVLARQLLEDRPDPFDTVEVLVNTWPTSRWLGEQLATANGITSLVRFPFPGSRLRQLVRQVLDLPEREDDPWRATTLVWSVLELLPHLLDQPQAALLRDWLNRREPGRAGLTRDRWQLARAIADAFDDYALYRPEVLRSWLMNPIRLEDWQPFCSTPRPASSSPAVRTAGASGRGTVAVGAG